MKNEKEMSKSIVITLTAIDVSVSGASSVGDQWRQEEDFEGEGRVYERDDKRATITFTGYQ